MSNALDVVPEEARKIIVDELERRDPALLADLRNTVEPTADQRSAVERVLASAVINSMGVDWAPNERGLAVERAIDTLMNAWPRYDD